MSEWGEGEGVREMSVTNIDKGFWRLFSASAICILVTNLVSKGASVCVCVCVCVSE